jgi:hypothetical protein
MFLQSLGLLVHIWLVAGASADSRLGHVRNCNGYCIDEEFLDPVVAVAEVAVSTKSRSKAVKIDRWLLPSETPLASNALDYGPCIPDAGRLREMLNKGGDYLNRGVVSQALKEPSYSIIIFVRHAHDGELVPYCTQELAINWLSALMYAGRLA